MPSQSLPAGSVPHSRSRRGLGILVFGFTEPANGDRCRGAVVSVVSSHFGEVTWADDARAVFCNPLIRRAAEMDRQLLFFATIEKLPDVSREPSDGG